MQEIGDFNLMQEIGDLKPLAGGSLRLIIVEIELIAGLLEKLLDL